MYKKNYALTLKIRGGFYFFVVRATEAGIELLGKGLNDGQMTKRWTPRYVLARTLQLTAKLS